MWLLVKFFLRDTAGGPERARWLHLARSGSQSHRAIWFILPACRASHTIRSYIAQYLGLNIAAVNRFGSRGPFVWDMSPKSVDREGLGDSRKGTRQYDILMLSFGFVD